MRKKEINSASLLESFRGVLSFYFGEVSLKTIEKLSFSELEKFSLKDLYQVSKELSLDIVEFDEGIEKVEAYMLPFIALSKDGKSVLVTDVDSKKRVVTVKSGRISDTKRVTYKQFGKSYKKFLIFANKMSSPEVLKIGDKKDKSWFFEPIKREWRSYIEIAILTLFINIFGLALPLFTMSVYNRVVPNFATDTLLVLAVGVGVVLLFDLILKSARVSILERVVKKISNHLEEELFKRALTIESRYDNYLSGTKTNFFRELHVVKDFFATKSIHILDLPFFVTAMVVIYLIDPIMVTVPLVIGGAILLFNFIMQYPIASYHKKSFEEGQTKQGYLVEQLQGVEAIKLANALPSRLYKWRRMVNFYHHLQGKIQFLSSLSSSVSATLLQLVSLLTITLGVYSIHEGSLNVGGLIAVTILASRAMVPIINLSNIMIKYKQVKEALNSLNEYWHLPTERSGYKEIGFGKAKGEISFEGVSFAYPGSEMPVIRDMTFKIKAGERVGIIGQTGAGKSTIQKLLCGLIKPTKGKIYLDGSDISILHPVELRENVALMPQEPYLFSGTLKENLELSKKISKERMRDILAKTGLDELLKGGQGAEVLNVGERGSRLSVGQRHLVALARAMMSEAPVMILDEPTTGLDVGLERKLVEHLNSSLRDKTLIVITHRFAALDLVDRVIVVDRGRVVADGKKEEIIEMLKNPKVKSDG
jgi:ATP-binding cassette subfamily B protein/ATP-binding cassette subfamily C protein LapB